MSGTRRSRKRTRGTAPGTATTTSAPAPPAPPVRSRGDWLRLFLPLAAGAVVGIVLTAYGLGWIQLLIVLVAFGVMFSSLARIRRAQRATAGRR